VIKIEENIYCVNIYLSVMSIKYEGKKYVTDIGGVKNMLKQYGVAVIHNVLDSDECDTMLSEIWDFFEHITQNWEIPVRRNKKDSWRGLSDLYPLHTQLHQYWNVGQCQASWNLRTNLNIIEIFSHLWRCEAEDLLVSFDGLSLCPPPEVTNKGYLKH